MTKYWYCLFFFIFGIFAIQSQDLSKDWSFQSTEKSGEIQNNFSPKDILSITDGRFEIKSAGGDTIKSQGDYLYQNNLLVFFYNPPNDTIRKYRISEISDSSLIISDNYNTYKFKERPELLEDIIPVNTAKQIIPSSGFSVSSLWRGLLGMLALLLIAYFFSSNKKAINWKTVLIGLAAQMLLAIGVLKITFVKNIFEFVGKIFVLILDFTRAGSEFLLGGMMDIESFGFIFLFQVLPTIIFFSALTSVLFYLGVIQIIVKGLAWVLTKLMGISGAESLSVAGNIFLGQTEAPLMIKAYLERMNRSEILLVMIGGMATVAGGVLAAYIGFLGGDDQASASYTHLTRPTIRSM